MKKLNIALAASALGLVAAQSNAALLPISVVSTNVTSGQVTGTTISTATGTLNDVTGELTWTATTLAETSVGGGAILATSAYITTDTVLQFTSAPDMNGQLGAFQVATTIACTETGAGLAFTTCAAQPPGAVAQTFGIVVQGTPTGFVYSTTGTSGAGAVTLAATTTITLEASEIPVPAAAWLFGSALIGLAGIGRKRK